jgi:hypothetical protein
MKVKKIYENVASIIFNSEGLRFRYFTDTKHGPDIEEDLYLDIFQKSFTITAKQYGEDRGKITLEIEDEEIGEGADLSVSDNVI